ncbi:MAG: hypothetical protein GC205_02335 [Bacteroidetes bacterium]|nr:hypothetical protein [Bacteroidota bacterium]
MSPALRNVLAVIAGLLIGLPVNMGLIILGPMVIPPPPGADFTSPEGLEAAMPLMEPRHFVFPFLAHALGTLVGAIFTARFAASRQTAMALVVGVFFLAGGIANVSMLPSPMWFNALDLLGAYLPIAFLGGQIGRRMRSSKGVPSSPR